MFFYFYFFGFHIAAYLCTYEFKFHAIPRDTMTCRDGGNCTERSLIMPNVRRRTVVIRTYMEIKKINSLEGMSRGYYIMNVMDNIKKKK